MNRIANNIILIAIFGCLMLFCLKALSEIPQAVTSEDLSTTNLRNRVDSILRTHGTGHYLTREAWIELANHYTEAKSFKESADIWRLIAQSRESSLGSRSGKTSDAYYQLGLMLERSGKLKEAEDALEHCVSMNPIKPCDGGLLLDYYGLLSYVQYKLGHWGKARKTCRLWLALEHTHVDTEAWAHRRLAYALSGMKAFEQAKLEMELAISLYWRTTDSHDGFEAHLDYARILNKAGKLQEAERTLRSLMDSAGRNFQTDIPVVLQTCHELAICLRGQTRIEEATIYSERACAGLDRWKEMDTLKPEFQDLRTELRELQTTPSPHRLVKPTR